jgi:hypothetical protein
MGHLDENHTAAISRMHQNLPCFQDNIYKCLCNNERQVNCDDRIYCKNDAQCCQNHPTCPTKSLCVCSECFYGSRCQIDHIINYWYDSNQLSTIIIDNSSLIMTETYI